MRRQKTAFQWVCLAIVVGITGQLVSQEAKEITCTGKIIDAEGNPIAGARVTLYQVTYDYTAYTAESKLTGEVTTTSDGVFSFKAAVETDDYSTRGYIVVKKEGLALGWAEWDMRADKQQDIILSEPKELSGIVVDEEDKPVPDANVSIWVIAIGDGPDQQGLGRPVAEKLFTETTDTSGRFKFTNIPAGATADFIIKKSGKATINTYRSTGYANQKMTFATGQKDIKLVLPVEARIEGTVVVKDTGKTVVGTNLLITTHENRPLFGQEHVISKNDGTFSIDALAAGNYLVQLVRSREETSEWIAEPVEVKTEAGQVEKNVKIELTKGGLLEILVTVAGTGNPIEGASVSIYNEQRRQSSSGQTGKDGVGRIRLLPGVYQWGHAFKSDFASFEHRDPVTIEEGSTKRLEWQLSSLPKISGVVRDPAGKPVEGVELAVCPMGGRRDVKSDAEGKFHVSWDTGMAVDERQAPILVCRYIKDNLAAAVIIPEDKRMLDITLKPGIIATGQVLDPNGHGIANAQIRIMLRQTMWGSTMSRESVRTGAGGNFEISALPIENRYELTINAKGYGGKRVEINADDAVDGQIKIEELTLPVANLAVSGLVVDTQGNPVANTRIESYNYKGGQPERLIAQTDSQGKFTLDGVCEGELNIRVNADHDGKRLSAYAITNGGASDIKIVVREGRSVVQNLGTKTYEQIIQSGEKVIAGVALDENGSPVADVPVGVCCIKRLNENGKFSWTFSDFSTLSDITDEKGRFAIELQEDAEYNLLFSPDNHAAIIVYDIPSGTKDLKVTLPEGGTVIGRLVRVNKGKKVPIPNVEVKIEQTDRSSYTYLDSESGRTTVTDSEGRFRFEHIRTKIRPSGSESKKSWEHVPRVWEISYGDTSKTIAFYDGTTIEDFELVVKPSLSDSQILVGGALPAFDGIKIDLSEDQKKEKSILICFFDMNQRPSRNCLRQLSERAQELKTKDILVVAVQSSKTDENTLNEWTREQSICFSVGIVEGDEEETRFAWGVKSLPWLILTDREHIIRAEGFALTELDEKLKANM